MPDYKYRGVDGSGQPVSGVIAAESQEQAVQLLTGRGNFLTSIELDRDLKASDVQRISLKGWLSQRRVTTRDLSVFCRQFAVLYGAGVSILPTLQAIRLQYGAESTLGQALERLSDLLQRGESLAVAMRSERIFPPILVNMIAAGEVGGNMDESLLRASNYFDREHQVAQKVKNALTYPKFIATFALLITWFLMAWVMPNFASMFASFGAELPALTQFMLNLSDFIQQFGWLLAIFLVVGYLGWRYWSRTQAGREKVDRVALKLPIFGKLIAMNALSRFCRTLAVLTRSGVNVVGALRLAEQATDNEVFAQAVQSAAQDVAAGGRIAPGLERSGLFPPLVVQMISVGESSGSLDSMLNQMADFYDQDIMTITDQIGKLIEPLVLVTMAIIVGAIALAIALPMMSMAEIVGF
jgi:type IV pilus assembly protein PilC